MFIKALIEGFGVIADGFISIFSCEFRYNIKTISDQESRMIDKNNIYNDWVNVGNDMRKVMGLPLLPEKNKIGT